MLRLTNIRLADDTPIPDIEADNGKDSFEEMDMGSFIAVPGFFDSHIHGSFGCDVSDGRAEDVVKLASLLPGFGVSEFLPTLMTLDEDHMLKAAGAVSEAIVKLESYDGAYAGIAGLRLEGPLLNPERACAQNPDNLVSADIFASILEKLEKNYPGLVKMIDIAPELPGAVELVQAYKGKYVFSLAHSDCGYETSCEFFNAGGGSITHALNAMKPCLKREPGPLGAAFDNENAYIEVICDGIHIEPTVLKMLFRLFEGRIIVISDAMRAGGMPDGSYDLGGTIVESRGGRTYFGPSGNLGGSVTWLAQEAQRLYSYGVSKSEIVKALTVTPRKRLNINDDSDFTTLNFLDSEMRFMCMISRGRIVSPFVML